MAATANDAGTIIFINTDKGYALVEVINLGRAIMGLDMVPEEAKENLRLGATVLGTVFTKFNPKTEELKHSFSEVDSVHPRFFIGRIKYWNEAKNFGKVEVRGENGITEAHLPGRVLEAGTIRPVVGTPLYMQVEMVIIKGEQSWTAMTAELDEKVVELYRSMIDEAKPAAKQVELGLDAVVGLTKSYRPGKFGFVTVDGKDCFLSRTTAEESSVPLAMLEQPGNEVRVSLKSVQKGFEVTAIALVKNEATAATTEAPTEVAPADTGAAAEGAGPKKRRIKSRKVVAAAPAAPAEAEAEAEAPAGDIPNLVASASPAEATDEGTLAAALKAAGVAPAAEKAA